MVSRHDGLLHEMLDHELSPELIRRVVIDFIIAAGDTVSANKK